MCSSSDEGGDWVGRGGRGSPTGLAQSISLRPHRVTASSLPFSTRHGRCVEVELVWHVSYSLAVGGLLPSRVGRRAAVRGRRSRLVFTADRIEIDHPIQVGTLGPGGQRISGASGASRSLDEGSGRSVLLAYLPTYVGK